MNRKLHGLVTVRSQSTRLPGKCFLEFGSSPTVIEHVINRSRKGGIEPIICTTNESTDDVFEVVALKNKCRIFRGPTKNKLKRWIQCAEKFGLPTFHTVDADDPFFDPIEMKRSMDMLEISNYSVVFPSEYSSSGGATSGYSMRTKNFLHTLCQPDNVDTEMLDVLLKQLPEKEKGVVETVTQTNARLTLDYNEDYWLLAFIAKTLGNNCNRIEIDELFRRNPDLYKINWFRNLEWKINQNVQRENCKNEAA